MYCVCIYLSPDYGCTPPSCSVAHLAHRAKGKHARDGTVYGRSRTSARSFFAHHTQRISMAAAYGDVKGIHESVRGLKQRAAAGRLGHAARA